MCGIAGILGAAPRDLLPLAAMVEALRHRGPDGEGYLLARTRDAAVSVYGGPDAPPSLDLPYLPPLPDEGADLALGHRRLAILDLSAAGHQPMGSADGRLWIVFNGEIYNYLELRAELTGLGHRFRTSSDTEVLLAAYAQWGEEALPRLNGMWAFAIYDAPRRSLFCARDRFGVKPFFYYWDRGLFAFASEIKGLLAHPGVPRRPDDAALVGFLTRGYLDEGERTFFEGVRTLAASHSLRLDLPSRELRVHEWYRPPDGPAAEPDAGRFRELLEDAVRVRLRSDVDVGTCLSGGLDSSSIVVLASRLRRPPLSGRQQVFSVLYDDSGMAEAPFVEAIVGQTNVIAERATPTARELVDDLPGLVGAQDEPIPSSGIYSQWRVMKLARAAGVKVLLDGQGADEVLGGYHYHLGPFLAEALRGVRLGRFLHELRLCSRVTGHPVAWLLGLAAFHALPLPASLRRRVVAANATHRYLPLTAIRRDLLTPTALGMGQRHAPRSNLRSERLANIFSTSLPALLRYEDRNSMAFGIEARTPFLDYRLVEHALALPSQALVRDGWTKRILRDAMAGLLPDVVRLRRDKLGFPTPEVRWLDEAAPQVREWLGAGARVTRYLRSDVLEAWLAGSSADLARRAGLWRLISAELWLRHVEALQKP